MDASEMAAARAPAMAGASPWLDAAGPAGRAPAGVEAAGGEAAERAAVANDETPSAASGATGPPAPPNCTFPQNDALLPTTNGRDSGPTAGFACSVDFVGSGKPA